MKQSEHKTLHDTSVKVLLTKVLYLWFLVNQPVPVSVHMKSRSCTTTEHKRLKAWFGMCTYTSNIHLAVTLSLTFPLPHLSAPLLCPDLETTNSSNDMGNHTIIYCTNLHPNRPNK